MINPGTFWKRTSILSFFLWFSGITLAPSVSANIITDENLNTGTRNWVLSPDGSPTAASDTIGQIKGYTNLTSVNKGGQIQFKVTVSPAQNFTIEIYRVGWYGGNGGRLMQTIGPIAGVTQPACPRDETTRMVECQWSTSHTLTIPTTWVSGVYFAKFKNTNGFDSGAIFAVRDDARRADFLYQLPVNTYQAYNNFPDGLGGNSTYGNSAGELQAFKVSFNRPYADNRSNSNGYGDFVWYELPLVKWLEKMGYDVAYTTSVDVHANGNSLLNYTTFISPGHDEYWSKETRDATEAARAAKVNLAFFGSNDAYWQVRYEPASDGTPNRTMVAYKEYADQDPIADPALSTDLFRSVAVNRPEQSLLGVMFTGYNPLYSPIAFTDYIVKNSNHWVYQGTGLTEGQAIPKLVGYEIDTIFPGSQLQPSSSEFTILAESPYVDTLGRNLTHHAVIYKTPQQSWVFASGTMAWCWALDNDMQEASFFGDRRSVPMQIATKNILDRFRESGFPNVSITSPTPGATVTGSTVAIAADATDNVGVVGVQFKLDGANLGAEDTVAPYSVNWDTTGATNGSHTLTAVARDTAGNTKVSAAVAVTVNNAALLPDVIVTAFSYSNGIFTSTIKNQGSAPTPAGISIGVGYFVDGRYRTYGSMRGPLAAGATATIGTATAYIIPSGTHTILAKVDDINRFAESDESNNSLSQTIQIGGSDSTPPTVALTSPASGATVSGNAQVVTATAADNVGVIGVQFKLDGDYLGAEDTVAPYSVNWDTTGATNGSHTLTAVARDAAGNSVTSAGVSVTVNNSQTLLSDVIVTDLAYSNGVFTSTIKNQGTQATPAGVKLGVSYYVDGVYKAYGTILSANLAAGASVTVGTTSATYIIPGGNHTIAALADDNNRFAELDETNNQLSKQVTITLNDTTPPTVAITAPLNDAVLPRSTVPVTATANDNIGVNNVQFKLDGANLGSLDTSAPYSVNWATTTVADGLHTLTAVARDAAGNSTTSANVVVNVNNGVIGSLPDVIVTALSYSNGVFNCTVKNQGTAAVPAGMSIGVSYYVNGVYRSYGSTAAGLAAGASVNIGTTGPQYVIPSGNVTISTKADDNNRFAELDETNNLASQPLTVP